MEELVLLTADNPLQAARAGLGIDPSVLIQRADAALYRAKREGRNRKVVEGRLAA